MEPLIKITGLKEHFPVRVGNKKMLLKAVDGVDLEIRQGETVGLVGESGCGKSTLGRTIIKLYKPSDGNIYLRGKDITKYSSKQMRNLRRDMQMIFQDPYASLNPRKDIFKAVKAPLDAFASDMSEQEKNASVEEMLRYVGIGEYQFHKMPHELSGGQRQRVTIARAMITRPSFVVCDEPVSALDVSVRAQVLNLMKTLQTERKLSYLFISHDMSVVRFLCDTVAVMYLGQIVEYGSRDEIFENPIHPYTKALLSAIPIPDVGVEKERIVLTGDVPSPVAPPSGCRFHNRCPYATDECAKTAPELSEINANHKVACIKAGSRD